jgi:hypothetical protein
MRISKVGGAQERQQTFAYHSESQFTIGFFPFVPAGHQGVLVNMFQSPCAIVAAVLSCRARRSGDLDPPARPPCGSARPPGAPSCRDQIAEQLEDRTMVGEASSLGAHCSYLLDRGRRLHRAVGRAEPARTRARRRKEHDGRRELEHGAHRPDPIPDQVWREI